MKRLAWIAAVALPLFTFALARPYADVKTREQTNLHGEGLVGFFLNRTKAGKEGAVNTAAVKGNRKATTIEDKGEIIDLGEERVYSLEYKKKEYSVETFDQIRQRMRERAEKAREQQQKQQPSQKGQPEKPQKEYAVDFDVKETGQKKTLIGYDTKETIATITVHEKGKTLEEGGGMVMTNDMWLAPSVTELKELADFEMRYWKALREGAGIPSMSPEQMAQIGASLGPLFGQAMERMQKDGSKLSGTAIDTTMTIEVVKDPAEAQAQADQQSGGGGIGGMLARKMMKKNDSQRSTPFTMHHQYLEISKSVDAADLAVPAGFKDVTKK